MEKGLLAVLLIFLILFAAGIHSNFLFNIVNLIGTLTGIWLVSIIIKEKMPFTRLMARGFIFNLAGTLLSVFMLMLLAKGVKHLLVSDFPFVFVKLGILAELFYFNMAIFLKWHWQEKELALQQLQTALEVERVKTRISAELHDDVGSMLSGISMYSHMAIQQAGMKDELAVRDSLQTIQQSSDEMVNRLKDMVWFNKQGAGSVTAMVERLKEYAAMMCRAKGIELKMEITSALNGLNLPEEIVYNIYLVGKEAVNNAVKYSGATELVIRTSISKGQLALAVSDNGKGFNPEAGYAGNGINNMKKRAEETGGQLSILSGAKAGTEISYCCKIT